MPGLLDVAVTDKVCDSFAAPELIPVSATDCAPTSSFTVRLLIAASVGISFTALTVTVNVRLIVLLIVWPSLTVTVMVAVPLELAVGVNVKLPVALGLV